MLEHIVLDYRTVHRRHRWTNNGQAVRGRRGGEKEEQMREVNEKSIAQVVFFLQNLIWKEDR